MVRLWSPEDVAGRDLHCDNFEHCDGLITEHGTMAATQAYARAHGWHIFDGDTYGGEPVFWVLCDACVGQRGRLPKPPPNLPGQEELF